MACAVSATIGVCGRCGLVLADVLGRLDAVETGHLDVHQDHVETVRTRRLDSLEAVRRERHVVAGAGSAGSWRGAG